MLDLDITNGGIHGNAVWLADSKGCVCVCVCVWHPVVCYNMKQFHVANTNCNNSSKLVQHLFSKEHGIGPIHEVTAIITCHRKLEWYESGRKMLNIFIVQSYTTQSHFS